jgi:hypothetical protein
MAALAQPRHRQAIGRNDGRLGRGEDNPVVVPLSGSQCVSSLVPAAAALLPSRYSLDDLHALIVDDNLINRTTLQNVTSVDGLGEVGRHATRAYNPP